MNNEYTEMEFKYKADNVSLQDFLKLMSTSPIIRQLDTSSWDHYFVRGDDFQRFRNGETPELTRKVKTKTNNNWVRVEVDLPLDPKRITEETVTKYLELEGYKPNFKVFKTCFIFWEDQVNYVYYIVFDQNMKELNRFIEIEVNKTGTGNIDTLNKTEEKLSVLGISPQNRMKKSLFELYRR